MVYGPTEGWKKKKKRPNDRHAIPELISVRMHIVQPSVGRTFPLLLWSSTNHARAGRRRRRPAVHIQSPNLRLTNHDFGFTARLLGVRLLLRPSRAEGWMNKDTRETLGPNQRSVRRRQTSSKVSDSNPNRLM